MWTVLLVLALVLSGAASDVGNQVQAMTAFHNFYCTLVNEQLTITITSSPPFKLNFTEISELEAYYERILSTLSNDTIQFNGTAPFDAAYFEQINYTDVVSLTLGNASQVMNSVSGPVVSTMSLPYHNTTLEALTLRYVVSRPEYSLTVSTTGAVEDGRCTYLLTFLYYVSPEVNITDWFGDWITLDFTHSLSEHYAYIAEVLDYARSNIYSSKNDIHAYFLYEAYGIMAGHCMELSNAIAQSEYDVAVEQAVVLAIDPSADAIAGSSSSSSSYVIGKMGWNELFWFVVGLMILVLSTVMSSLMYALGGRLQAAARALLNRGSLWLAACAAYYFVAWLAGKVSIWALILTIASLVITFLGFLLLYIAWWEWLFVGPIIALQNWAWLINIIPTAIGSVILWKCVESDWNDDDDIASTPLG